MMSGRLMRTWMLAAAVLAAVQARAPGNANAQAAGLDATSALRCTAAYQVDWQSTTSPERSAADRKGAETTYEAYRKQTAQDDDAVSLAVTGQAEKLQSSVRAGTVNLADTVAACDKVWGASASQHATQYAPPPAQAASAAAENDVVTFENTAARTDTSAEQPAISRQCETTDNRAAGIMNMWRYAVQDYAAETVRDFDTERELSDLYKTLRSRLQDEMSSAETYGCDQLAGDIRSALSEWTNPF